MNPILITLILISPGLTLAAETNSTLKRVQERGELICGIHPNLEGFSKQTPRGEWRGMDVAFCRAVASAVLKDSNKVRFIPLSELNRFKSLQTGEIDLLSRNTTWAFSRENHYQFEFAGIYYYDGQGFMVPKKLDVSSVKQLSNPSICVSDATTTEINLNDYFSKIHSEFSLKKFATIDLAFKAYKRGQCQVLSSDLSALAALKNNTPTPADHILLPEIISKEPLSPVTRQGDPEWTRIVRWTLFTLINGEEAGITSKNIKEMESSTQPSIQRLLGKDKFINQDFPLDAEWSYRILSQVGNYQEIFDANLGENGLSLNRGLNQLWSQGGILYAPPML